MALITSLTIIKGLALFHLVVAYYFLTNPRAVANHNMVFILGQSMGLPPTSVSFKKSPATALLSVMFAFIGIIDLTAASMAEDLAIQFYSSQAPIRIIFLFVITGYTYMFKRGGMASGKGAAYTPGVGEELKNGLVFAWAFIELSGWFWAFISLREERRQRGIELMQKRAAEEEQRLRG